MTSWPQKRASKFHLPTRPTHITVCKVMDSDTIGFRPTNSDDDSLQVKPKFFVHLGLLSIGINRRDLVKIIWGYYVDSREGIVRFKK